MAFLLKISIIFPCYWGKKFIIAKIRRTSKRIVISTRAFEAGQAWDNMGFGTPQESTSSLSTPDRTASFFGQASYNYNHKYLLSDNYAC